MGGEIPHRWHRTVCKVCLSAVSRGSSETERECFSSATPTEITPSYNLSTPWHYWHFGISDGYAEASPLCQNAESARGKSRLTEANSSLAAENKSLADTNTGLSEESVRLAEQRKGLSEDTDRLTAEKKAYEAQTDEARKEARNAIRERDEAKAERDAQRKELGSNIANIFTGSKTKRLEAEIVRKNNEIREMKDRAEAREQDLHREISNLSDSLRRQKEHEADTIRSCEWKIGNFVKFFPDAVAMLPAIEECQDVGLNDNSIKGLLSMNEYVLKSGTTLYYPFQRREVDASGAKVQIKRDPADNKFHLHVNGTRIFQWLKDQWQRLTQTVKRGFGIK